MNRPPTSDYTLLNKLCTTQYCVLYVARHDSSGKLVLFQQARPNFEVMLQFEHETLQQLGSDSFLSVLDTKQECVILEYSEKTARSLLNEQPTKTKQEIDAVQLAIGVFGAIQQYERCQVEPGLLTPDNVFIFANQSQLSPIPFKAKLRHISHYETVTASAEAANFQAPENRNPLKHSAQETDSNISAAIWSAAAVVVMTMIGEEMSLDSEIEASIGVDNLAFSKQFRDLLKNCLSWDPASRPAPDYIMERLVAFQKQLLPTEENNPTKAASVYAPLASPSHDNQPSPHAHIPNASTSMTPQQLAPAGLSVIQSRLESLAELDVQQLTAEQIAKMLLSLIYEIQGLPPGIYDFTPKALLVDLAECKLTLTNTTPVEKIPVMSLELASMQSLNVHDEETTGSIEESLWSIACLGCYLITGQLPFLDTKLRLVCKRIEHSDFTIKPTATRVPSQLVDFLLGVLVDKAPSVEEVIALLSSLCREECPECTAFKATIRTLQQDITRLTSQLDLERGTVQALQEQLKQALEENLKLKEKLAAPPRTLHVTQDYDAQQEIDWMAPPQVSALQISLPQTPQNAKKLNLIPKDIVGKALSTACACNETSSSLATAADAGCIRCCMKYIDQAGQLHDDMTALMRAVRGRHSEIIKLLSYLEARVQNSEGTTALMLCATFGSRKIVDLLAAEAGMRNKRNITALYMAAAKGRQDIVEALLPYEGDCHQANGKTALMVAAGLGNTKVVKLLIPRQAGLQQTNGHTAMMYAAKKGHYEIVEMLRPHEGHLQSAAGKTVTDIIQEKPFQPGANLSKPGVKYAAGLSHEDFGNGWDYE